jgi:hypothetical protein
MQAFDQADAIIGSQIFNGHNSNQFNFGVGEPLETVSLQFNLYNFPAKGNVSMKISRTDGVTVYNSTAPYFETGATRSLTTSISLTVASLQEHCPSQGNYELEMIFNGKISVFWNFYYDSS